MLLLALCAVALASTLLFWALTHAATLIVRRLGAEPLDLLLWFGLAERPIEPRNQRRRLNEAYGERLAA